MKAAVGDTIAVPGKHVGDVGRLGLVVEVRGQLGAPPYRVRWGDGHEALCFPGPETRIVHDGHLT